MNGRKRPLFVRADEGSSMFEFAIVAALFVTILLGIVEFALASWEKNAAAYAAREGARYAIVRGATSLRVATPESVTTYVKSRAPLDTAAVAVYTTWTPDNTPGSVVTVSVAHTVRRRGLFIPAHRDSVTSKMQVYF
jgi:Flp pilus assembly protein TadG